MKKQNPPKRHHYIPQFLIKNFSQENTSEVYAYDFEYKKLDSTPRHSAKICFEPGLHTLITPRESFTEIETGYSTLETQWSQALELLTNLALEGTSNNINDFQKIFQTFIACQFWRTPARSKLAQESANKLLDYYDQTIDRNELAKSLINRKSLKQFTKNKNNQNVQKIIQFFLLPTLTWCISNNNLMYFRILKKPDDFIGDFICNDNMIVYQTIEETLAGENQKLFPLSRDLILSLENSEKRIDTQDLYEFQDRLFSSTKKWAFASSPDSLKRHIEKL